jgi:hypothetical protein
MAEASAAEFVSLHREDRFIGQSVCVPRREILHGVQRIVHDLLSAFDGDVPRAYHSDGKIVKDLCVYTGIGGHLVFLTRLASTSQRNPSFGFAPLLESCRAYAHQLMNAILPHCLGPVEISRGAAPISGHPV